MHNFPVSLSLSNLKTPMLAAVDGTLHTCFSPVTVLKFDANELERNKTVSVQCSWATSDLWLIQQNKFYWISHRSMVAQLNCTVTNKTTEQTKTFDLAVFAAVSWTGWSSAGGWATSCTSESDFGFLVRPPVRDAIGKLFAIIRKVYHSQICAEQLCRKRVKIRPRLSTNRRCHKISSDCDYTKRWQVNKLHSRRPCLLTNNRRHQRPVIWLFLCKHKT